MKHITLAALIAVLSIPITTPAQSPAGSATAGTPQVAPRPAARSRTGLHVSPIRAMMRKRVDRVSWHEAPFSDVLDWLRNQSTQYGTVNLIVNWRSMVVEDIDKQTPVSLEMKNVTVAEILDEVLDQLSGNDPLTWLGTGNILKIATKSAIRRKLITRTYDIAELVTGRGGGRVLGGISVGQQVGIATVVGIPGAGVGANVEMIDVGTQFTVGSGSGGGGGGSGAGSDSNYDEESADRLIEVIQNTVEPDSWIINGGHGTIEFFDGVLIVRNSLDIHALLGGPYR